MAYLDRFFYLKSIVEYCDDNKCFDSIRIQCDYFPNQEPLVYIFPINVNLHDLFEKSAVVGEKVLVTPVESSILFDEVIFEYIKCQELLPASVTYSQVLAKLFITDLPCKSFQICSLSDLTKHCNYHGLLKLRGFVSGVSGLTKYTQSTRYLCSDSDCEGHYGNHFIRIHIPGASETQTVRPDFMCTFCGRPLKEMISSRTLSDKMIAEVIPIKLEGHQRKESLRSQITQAVPVIIRDDLVKMIEIGKSYIIIGICRTDQHEGEVTVTLEIKSMVFCKPDVMEYLPNSITSIYHGSIVPLGKMIKLRLLLLISLVLPPRENKLHILAIGNESELAFAVMTYALQFSCRSSLASISTPLNGKVSNTKYPWTPYFIEGGSLLLSSSGICSLGEIGMWKKARREQLKTALSSNKVMVELPSKYCGSLPQMISFPISCQMWTIYGSSGTKTKSDNSHSDVFTGCFTGDLSKSFLDTFNIVAFLDQALYTYDEDSDLHFLDFMWRTHCPDKDDKETQLKVEAIDFEKYLSLASQLETQMSVEAEVLMHSYYSASRMARTSGCGGSDVPSSALATLTSLSMGIAKLQLHNIITENEATLAIYIYEEYLTSRWGVSVLNIQPQPDIPCYEVDGFLGMQTDIMMQQFYIRLQQFCTRVKDSVTPNNQLRFTESLPFKEEE